MFKVLVIDGQGGGIGKSIVNQLVKNDVSVFAYGLNKIAQQNMKKAGATIIDSSVLLSEVMSANVIVGPIGIIVYNAINGEITKQLVEAVTKSNAQKILIPFNKCNVYIAGIVGTMSENVLFAVDMVLEKKKAYENT